MSVVEGELGMSNVTVELPLTETCAAVKAKLVAMGVRSIPANRMKLHLGVEMRWVAIASWMFNFVLIEIDIQYKCGTLRIRCYTPLQRYHFISLILNVCEIAGMGLGFAEWVPACISIPPDPTADLLYAEALWTCRISQGKIHFRVLQPGGWRDVEPHSEETCW